MKVKIFTYVMLLTLLFVVPSYAQETTPAEQNLDEIPITVLESGTKVQVADMEAAEQDYQEKLALWAASIQEETNIPLRNKIAKEFAEYPAHFVDICVPDEYILVGVSEYQGMVNIKDEVTGNIGWFTLKTQPHPIDDATRKKSTQALFTDVLALDFIGGLSYYDQTAYASLVDLQMWQFEVLDEFLHREDVTEVLFDGYRHAKLYKTANSRNFFDIYDALQFLMVADQKVNGTYTKDELLTLQKIYEDGQEAKKKLPLLVVADSCFFRDGRNSFDLAKDTPGITWTTTSILSPSGLIISLKENRSPELDSTTILWTNECAADDYHSAYFIATATRKYNCHSYAWCRRTTSNIWWLDSPANFLRDKQVTLISDTLENSPGKDRVRVGDIAYWTNGSHSAEVVSGTGNTIRVRSKWGEKGLYEHNWYDCEYIGPVWVYRMPPSWSFA